MNYITQDAFINAIFPPDLLLPDEMPLVCYPDSYFDRSGGVERPFHRQMRYRPGVFDGEARSWFFCVATVCYQRVRQVKRTGEHIRSAMVLVCDDIGTKAEIPPVPPSYIIETSQGNYQYGWLIDPFDVSTPAGQAYYASCPVSLAAAGYNDPGCIGVTRIVRVPGSLHKTGFAARLVAWDAGVTWDLRDLMLAMAVPMVAPRRGSVLQPGAYTALDDVVDEVYRWLVANWTVYGHSDQWVHIECPWRSSHTDGAQGASSTSYSPDGYGRAGRGFKCLHGHCAGRHAGDFINFIYNKRNSHA